MVGNVSLFWSHLTYVPFCTDPELWFLQPFFFGAWYWERWKQEGWCIRLVRLWSCSEFSEYQTLPWQEGHIQWFSFPPPLLQQNKGRAVTLCCVSRRCRAGPVATATLCQQGGGLPGKSQGWGRDQTRSQVSQTGFQICRMSRFCQEWVQLQQVSQQPGPRPDGLGQSWLEHRQIWMGNCALSIFLKPLFITLQSSASGVHLYLHSSRSSLHRNKGCAGQQMVC